VSLACCYLPFSVLVTHVSTHVTHHASVPAGDTSGPTAADWTTAISTVVLAVATIVLAAFAIVTAYYASKAFRAQSKEVKDQARMLKVQSKRLDEERMVNEEHIRVLNLQARELEESLAERKREREQRHRDQASRVFITQERHRTAPRGYEEREDVEPFVAVTVVNSSEQPIYNAELRWHIGTADHGEQPNPEPLGTIMPGPDGITRMRTFPYGVDLSNSGAVVRFTDATGVRWLRRPDGYLNEFHQP
jgi:hypothetical protein